MLRSVQLIVVCLFSVKYSEACNGYTVTLDQIKTCTADSVARPVGITSSLDKDCNIVMNGCLEMTKPVKYSKGKYVASKPPLPEMSGDIDLCDLMENGGPVPQIDEMVTILNVPKKCPMEAKKYCISPKKNKISISAFKKKLAMGAGTTTVKLDVGHDTGRSCVEFKFSLNKPRTG
ncbi:unnamed protein product [Phaedon cochleariae]|uniref:MD-2-related lipid-recognition domain-containing protein n=1 Tax=Phaedon cochleariae TaxID=80249 RepID=A0A9P0GQI9_PHACE|nr:unnamed protein product [Phaedon cochleariae]